MHKLQNVLYAMISIRILSSMIELMAAFLMYRFKTIETAIRINAFLGLVGPVVLMSVTFIGLVGIRHDLNLRNLIFIFLGVALIILGTR